MILTAVVLPFVWTLLAQSRKDKIARLIKQQWKVLLLWFKEKSRILLLVAFGQVMYMIFPELDDVVGRFVNTLALIEFFRRK